MICQKPQLLMQENIIDFLLFWIFKDGYDGSTVEAAAVSAPRRVLRLESPFLAMIYGSERLNRCSRVLQRPKLSNSYIRSVRLNQTKMMNEWWLYSNKHNLTSLDSLLVGPSRREYSTSFPPRKRRSRYSSK